MAVLVDSPRWQWRGQRWAHLVSDHSEDELHVFAAALGLRRLSFQGDHYDVPAPVVEHAIALGARLVDSRELVRRLRESGLRHRAAMGWVTDLHLVDEAPDVLVAAIVDHGLVRSSGLIEAVTAQLPEHAPNRLIVIRRPAELGIGITRSANESEHRVAPDADCWVTALPDGFTALDWLVEQPL